MGTLEGCRKTKLRPPERTGRRNTASSVAIIALLFTLFASLSCTYPSRPGGEASFCGSLADWGLDLWDLLTVLFYVVIFLLPGVLFLLSLRGLLASLSESSRALAPNTVWLHLIPGFNLGWFLYTVVKVRDSLRMEYQLRGWPGQGNSGYRMGLTTGILFICLVALGWVPFVGWLIGVATLVCGGLYWIRVVVIRRQLQEAGPPRLHPISPPPFTGEL